MCSCHEPPGGDGDGQILGKALQRALMVAIRVATLLLCAGAPVVRSSLFAKPDLNKAVLNQRRLQTEAPVCAAATACANESPDDIGVTETCFVATSQYAPDFPECTACTPPVTSSATVCPACEAAFGAALVTCSGEVPSGEDVCEGHGFDEQTCQQQGCCQWDNGACRSDVGPNPCSAGQSGSSGDPCPAEGSACMGAPACASIIGVSGEPDWDACSANAECAAFLRCHMDAGPPPDMPPRCKAAYDACTADSACLAAMMTVDNLVIDYRTCVANKLCRPLYLCVDPGCTPARSPGCTLRRVLINDPAGLDNAHEFVAKALLDEGNPLAARLFQ